MSSLRHLKLEQKIKLTNSVIIDWYENHYGRVFVAFSGSYQSSVLLDLVRKLYPDVPAVFVHSEIDYPEKYALASRLKNMTILPTKMKYQEVIMNKGFQVVSREISANVASYRNTGSPIALRTLQGKLKNNQDNVMVRNDWTHLIDAPFKISCHCCNYMKFAPLRAYASKHKLSMYRANLSSTTALISNDIEAKNLCNKYDKLLVKTRSFPLMFWKSMDIMRYIYQNDIPYSKHFGEIYYDGHQYTTERKKRKGCMLCLCGLDKQDRECKFLDIKEQYPDYYKRAFEYHRYGVVCDYLGYKY